MSASDAAPLPRLGEVFFDVRGDSRSMRLSWYADTGVAVFSVWSGGRCTGTFRLPIDDLPRMIEILQRGPERRRRPAPDGGRGERADRGRPRNEPGYYGEGDYSDGDYGDGDFGDSDVGDGGGRSGGGRDDAGYEPGARDRGGYDLPARDVPARDQPARDQGGYDLPARDLSARDQDGYDQGGYSGAGYGTADHRQGGARRDSYAADGYGADRPGPGGHGSDRYGTDAYGPDGYGPDGYGADDHVRATRRPDGGHWSTGAAESPGYPDVPGHGGAALAETSRPGASRSDVPTASNWRAPDDYQPAEYQTGGYQPGDYQADGYQPGDYQAGGYQPGDYHAGGYQPGDYHAGSYQPGDYQADGYEPREHPADGYEPREHPGDGYEPREHPADGYQTAAYQFGPADHAAGPHSDPAGYGEERFVPPYVQARSDAYPNGNPAPGRARRQGGSGPDYPADQGGVSAEPHPYARSPRSGPGYFDGSEDRLAADTPASARYSAGGRGS